MAALAIAAVGAFAGSTVAASLGFTALIGAQIGWGLGSLAGSLLFKEKTPGTEGPRLTDLRVTTSGYGTVIPRVYGTPRIAGSIIQASDKREIATGRKNNISYTYEVDLCYELSENETIGVKRVWWNGQMVWTCDFFADTASKTASINTQRWRRMTVYTGESTQLPDPCAEALLGVGNCSANRTRTTVWFEGLQLGNSWDIPNLEFEMASHGSGSSDTEITSLRVTPDVIINDLLLRCGMTAEMYDLEQITEELDVYSIFVEAMVVAQIGPTRAPIEALMQTYFINACGSDKIRFSYRNRDDGYNINDEHFTTATPIATIPYSDLGVYLENEDQPDRLPLAFANELELTETLDLSCLSPERDYQPATYRFDLAQLPQLNVKAINVPIAFRSATANKIAQALVADRYVQATTSRISIGIQYLKIEPGDIIEVENYDGYLLRFMVTRRTDSDNMLHLDIVGDDHDVLSMDGIDVWPESGNVGQENVGALPDTGLVVADLPLLLDEHNFAGDYFFVHGVPINGYSPAWYSASVYESNNALSAFQWIEDLQTQTVFGSCLTTLADWTGGTVFDNVNVVRVDIGAYGELFSVTRAELLENRFLNLCAIGHELVQYQTKTLISPSIYDLSNLIRGRRGTEWAEVGHAASERFIMLDVNDLHFDYFVAGVPELGQTRYYQATSEGQPLFWGPNQIITPTGVNLKPFSPVLAKVDRTLPDFVITFQWRTRFAYRVGGPMPQYIINSDPLGFFVVEFYSDGTYTTLLREITSATPSVTYTAAMQAADSYAGTLFLKIEQVSQAVGKGYPLTVQL